MGVLASILVVAPLGPNATVPRTTGATCQGTDSLTLCLWPEHERARDTVFQALVAGQTVAEKHALPFPSRFSEAHEASGDWERLLVADPSASEGALQLTALGAVPPGGSLDCDASTGPVEDLHPYEAFAVLQVWWQENGIRELHGDAAGIPPATGVARVDDTLETLRSIGADATAAWVEQASDATRTCSFVSLP